MQLRQPVTWLLLQGHDRPWSVIAAWGGCSSKQHDALWIMPAVLELIKSTAAMAAREKMGCDAVHFLLCDMLPASRRVASRLIALERCNLQWSVGLHRHQVLDPSRPCHPHDT